MTIFENQFIYLFLLFTLLFFFVVVVEGGGRGGFQKTKLMNRGRKAKTEKKLSGFKIIQMHVEEALTAFFFGRPLSRRRHRLEETDSASVYPPP